MLLLLHYYYVILLLKFHLESILKILLCNTNLFTKR